MNFNPFCIVFTGRSNQLSFDCKMFQLETEFRLLEAKKNLCFINELFNENDFTKITLQSLDTQTN